MKNIGVPNELKNLSDLESGLVESPEPLLGVETIQIILAREIHDFTVLRTEPTRELNTTVTPTSLTDMTPLLRVVFLASKQKAVESRAFRSVLKTVKSDVGLPDNECYLKDKLCMSCPRCVLFGAVKTEKGQQEAIKHRVGYGSAFSLMPYEDIEAAFTFNAVDERTQSTGQALGTRFTVSPATIFPAIVTLRCATWRELIMVLKTILSTTNYGAENRICGEVRNHVIGIAAGWEEVITPLELSLELYTEYTKDDKNQSKVFTANGVNLENVLEKYKDEAVFGDKIQVLANKKLDELISSVKDFKLSKEFLETLDKGARDFKEKSKK
ncbi:MAG: type I-D CRISPR-associated protein Cas7/Csc2 [Thermotogota bacterium]|nr:type I-D CRISPR-associated protein Cas7/Csc2 [Thermotogota bacterium]